MLWVVIGHSIMGDYDSAPILEKTLFEFAYSFHMPLFIFISGYLFYMTRLSLNARYSKVLIDKARRLLIPGFAFSILALILKLAFPAEMDRQITLDFHSLVHIFLFPYDNPFRELWFIVTLMWMFILTPLWRISLKNGWSMALTGIVLVVLYFTELSFEVLCIGRLINYAVWFYLGILFCRYNLIEGLYTKYKFLSLLLGIILYIVGMRVDSSIVTLGGIFFSISLALILDVYAPVALSSFREYTYQIFLMGIFAQIFVKIVYHYIAVPRIVAYVLCIIAGLYVPVIVSKLLKTVGNKFLLICTGL